LPALDEADADVLAFEVVAAAALEDWVVPAMEELAVLAVVAVTGGVVPFAGGGGGGGGVVVPFAGGGGGVVPLVGGVPTRKD